MPNRQRSIALLLSAALWIGCGDDGANTKGHATAGVGGGGVAAAGGIAAGKGDGFAGIGAGSAAASGRGEGHSGGGTAASAGRAGVGGAGSSAGSAASAGHAAEGGGSGGRSGSTNRDTFFGDSRCAAAGLVLCDGFEAELDSNLWQTKLSAPTLDTTRAARGKQSLHVHTSATSGSGVQTSKPFATLGGSYYGRLFVYFEALPTSPQWAHWTIVGANPKSGSPINGEIRIGGQFDGKLERWGVGTDGGPTGDWTNLDDDPKGKALPVALGTWTCIEWLHDGDTDQTRFFWDGEEHPSLATTRDVKHGGNASVKYDLPDIGSIWVGFWNYDQGKAVMPAHFDVWIDEVALDTQRIGCSL